MMKSGWPALNTILEEACTQTQVPLLESSRKTLRPLSPVFITVAEDKKCTLALLLHDYIIIVIILSMFNSIIYYCFNYYHYCCYHIIIITIIIIHYYASVYFHCLQLTIILSQPLHFKPPCISTLSLFNLFIVTFYYF